MYENLLALPGRTLELLNDTLAIGYHGSLGFKDWVLHMNRLRVAAFVKRRHPDLFSQLDPGDVRLLSTFLEPEWVSNTMSMLVGRDSFNPTSEYRMDPKTFAGFLLDTCGPEGEPDFCFVEAQEGAYDGDERWFFIHGILTSPGLARQNADALRAAFNRPFITIHNPTAGLVSDFIECVLEKFTNVNTEPVAHSFVLIANALLDPSVKKVVVLGHSQGSIVAGDVLDLIYCSINEAYFDRTNMNDEDFESFMRVSHGTVTSNELQAVRRKLKDQKDLVCKKLELYLLASAASRVCYLDREHALPHIETFANEHDIITRLGCLARDEFHREDVLRIDGPVFMCPRYGHLLNAHYLPSLLAREYHLLASADGECVGDSVHDTVRGNPCAKNPLHVPGPKTSKLMHYLSGESSPKRGATVLEMPLAGGAG